MTSSSTTSSCSSKEFSSWTSSSSCSSTSSSSKSSSSSSHSCSSSSREFSSWTSSSHSCSSSSTFSSSSSSSAEVTSYVTKAEVVAILNSYRIVVLQSDITNEMINSTRIILEKKTNKKWVFYRNHWLYIDGRGHNVVFSPVLPIKNLHEVKLIAKDTSEDTYILTGEDRQIWWDKETGKIEIIHYDEEQIEKSDYDKPNVFIEGIRNVAIRGDFGELADDRVKLAQTFLILKRLALLKPSSYPWNVVSEKIGNYQYKLSEGGSGQKVVNFDSFLDDLLGELKDEESMSLEEI